MTHLPTFPEKVMITEVGPRDGLQMEKQILTIKQKIDLINGLAAAGIRSIQVGSFVHPKKVPQMADTEAVIAGLALDDGVNYSGLTLNRKGVERACNTAIPWVEVSFSASERQSRDNTGMSVIQAAGEAAEMIRLARHAGRKIRGSIQCVFGCIHECEIAPHDIVRLAALLIDQGIDELVLADTTGMAGPDDIRRILEAVLLLSQGIPICLHLHDTRGLGLVNLVAGLEMGITHFDTSLGGLGGCPFVQGAAGNIATEDTVHLLNHLGVQSGIDIAKVAQCSRKLSTILDHGLSGKIYRLDIITRNRCFRR
jgi:hydroxymethylglutaryl-CoA lyase